MQRGRGSIFLILFFLGGILSPTFSAAQSRLLCESTDTQTCRPLTPLQKTQSEACETELKASRCEDWFKAHPEAALKARRCDRVAQCPSVTKIADYAKACLQAGYDSSVDLAAGVFDFLLNDKKMTPEMKSREEFFKKCDQSPECKIQMLGPYADLFQMSEIIGQPDIDKNLNLADPAHQNYLQGLSSKTLYRRLLEKLRARINKTGEEAVLIEPWSGNPALLKQTSNDLIEKIMAEAGVHQTACYDPAVLAEMRCYAVAAVLDPFTAGAATLKISKLAGIGKAASGEKLSLIGKNSKSLKNPFLAGLEDKARRLDARDTSLMRPSAVDTAELKASVARVWDNNSLSYDQKMKKTFDKYIELRTADLKLEKKILADEALSDVRVDKDPNNGSWSPSKQKISLGENLKVDPATEYAALSHEFEHLVQVGTTPEQKVYAKAYKQMLDKNLELPTAPVSRIQAEYEAIGSQWDFLQAVPIQNRNEALEKLHASKTIPKDVKKVLVADISQSGLSREDYVKKVARAHGYSNYQALAEARMRQVFWLGYLTTSGSGVYIYNKVQSK